MKKVSKVFLTIFSVGVLLTLFLGALAFLGYLIALIIGGSAATDLCVFIYKSYFPWVIRICSIAVGFGLIGMYMEKQKALTFSGKESSEKK